MPAGFRAGSPVVDRAESSAGYRGTVRHAGTVLAHNATFVTRNLHDFERVPKLPLVNLFD